MIITIDGPAGAGKSTVAKMVAMRMGYQFLDTGAMYRAVTWAAIEKNVDPEDHAAVAKIAAALQFKFDGNRVLIDDQDVTQEIRAQNVTANVSEIADNSDVRSLMVMLQREMTTEGDYVCEGRDQGTVVFPNAECKIYLTASARERAKRRCEQLNAHGTEAEFETVLGEQEARDQRDLDRPVGRLLMATDAIEIISDKKTLEEVADEIEKIARSKITF